MKKLSLLLASIGAGLLLVGGTVAAYIVTAADQLGVRVSPGSIQTDTTGRVTLNWDRNTLVHVGNLEPQVETDVGDVLLGADIDEETLGFHYDGGFKVRVQNQSAASEHDLMDNLEVRVYENKTGSTDYSGITPTVLSPVKEEGGYKYVAHEFAARSGYSYKITVTLTANAGDEYYNDLLTQVAYATFDWGISSANPDGDIDADSLGYVYVSYKGLANNEDLYAYIYKGNKTASTIPGLKMEYVYDIDNAGTKLYSVAFDTETYDTFRFYKVEQGETPVRLTNPDVSGYTAAKPYYNITGAAWDNKPEEALSEFYVRGVINGENLWNKNDNRYALTQDTDPSSQFSINGVVLKATDELKVYKPSDDSWYGPSNWVITQDGTYDIHFDGTKPDGDGWSQHMIVVNMSYKAKVANGNNIQFYDNWDATSGADAEYKATFEVTQAQVSSGGLLTFTKDDNPLTYTAEAGEMVAFNVETKSFTAAGNYVVYLKLVGTNYSIYVANAA